MMLTARVKAEATKNRPGSAIISTPHSGGNSASKTGHISSQIWGVKTSMTINTEVERWECSIK